MHFGLGAMGGELELLVGLDSAMLPNGNILHVQDLHIHGVLWVIISRESLLVSLLHLG